MYDLRPYASRQAERLAGSDVYPHELFVPQRFTLMRARGPVPTLEPEADLLAQVREWIADLGTASAALGHLTDLQLTSDQASHMIGSGTLLVRTEAEQFKFVHRSVMEWLVAEHVARRLGDRAYDPGALVVRPMSELMADFVGTLAGRTAAITWARAMLADADSAPVAKVNALTLLRRLRVSISGGDTGERAEVHLAGADLQGFDLTAADLRSADLRNANLRRTRLDEADLSGATLTGAQLQHITGKNMRLVEADLTGADLSGARLVGADLSGAEINDTTWRRAALVSATIDSTAPIAQLDTFGAVLPERPPPSLQIASPQSMVTCLAWNPSGELIATGNHEGFPRIWDSTTGALIRTLEGHTRGMQAVAYSPDGTHLATASYDGTTRIWDTATGIALALLPLPDLRNGSGNSSPPLRS